MHTARMVVLLAAIGQPACSSGVRTAASPEKAESEVRFHEKEPPLPEGIACLDHPLEHYWHVSSKYRDPKHPFVPGKHYALDFPAPVGTPVLAAADGEVVAIGPVEQGKDAYVSVRFAEGWTYAVHHLSAVVSEIGQAVRRGDLLGLSGGAVGADGSGPWTTGPHLHFSVAYEGAFVNPAPKLCP